MSIVTVKNLSKEYTTYKREGTLRSSVKSLFHRSPITVKAVDDLSFTIEEGEIIGILGKNGAGKSTLIKMMSGVLFPSSGSVDVLGFNPSKERSRYVSHIGAVFGQKSQLIWDIPPVDSFLMNKAIYRIQKDAYKKTLDNMVEAFELQEIIHRPTRSLSLGERMKCEFIMAMLHDPRIVFLDEPTIGLDAIAKQTIRAFIREKNEKGTTFILTTHDLDDVEELSHRVLVINKGQKVFDDSLSALQHHLGQKHIVRIIAQTSLSKHDWSWADILESPSERELVLLADNDVFPLGEMISRLGQIHDIADISIESLPVEEIIRTLYEL